MASTAAIAVVFLLIAAAATVVFAQDPNNTGSGASHIERSGPFSTWPAAWTDFCSQPVFLGIRLPVFGDKTTVNEIVPGPLTPLPTVSLHDIYAAIVNSTAFQNMTAGLGWVTTYWGLQWDSGTEYMVGQFLLLSGNHPDEHIPNGIIQAFYNVGTGTVSVQTGIGVSCGAG